MERTMTYDRQRIGLLFCRGRAASASGLIFSSPAKVNLRRSKEKVFLHHSAVHFSTGGPVQFSPGIYKRYAIQVLVFTQDDMIVHLYLGHRGMLNGKWFLWQ